MCTGVEIALITTAIAGTAASISSQNAASDQADRQARAQAGKQKQLEDKEAARQQAGDKTAQRNSALARRRALAESSTGGNQSTVLTSPLGLTTEPNAPRKTLLGA